MYLIFDTETTGLPKRWNAPVSDVDNWPRMVQIAWQLHDDTGKLITHYSELIRPEGFNIPYESEQIHGISTALAQEKGIPVSEVLMQFKETLSRAKFIVGQNVGFDINILGAEFYRQNTPNALSAMPVLDTCTEVTALLCKIPGGRGGKFKLPTLTELYTHLFNERFQEAHNASADVEATARCFFELLRTGEGFTPAELGISVADFARFAQIYPQPVQLAGLKHSNLKAASEKIRTAIRERETHTISETEVHENAKRLEQAYFVHLHNHSRFSVLQATSNIKDIIKAASAENMPAVALTDTANMMGAFHFVKAANQHNKTVERKE